MQQTNPKDGSAPEDSVGYGGRESSTALGPDAGMSIPGRGGGRDPVAMLPKHGLFPGKVRGAGGRGLKTVRAQGRQPRQSGYSMSPPRNSEKGLGELRGASRSRGHWSRLCRAWAGNLGRTGIPETTRW